MKPEMKKKEPQVPMSKAELDFYDEIRERVMALANAHSSSDDNRKNVIFAQVFIDVGALMLRAIGGFTLSAEHFYMTADREVAELVDEKRRLKSSANTANTNEPPKESV